MSNDGLRPKPYQESDWRGVCACRFVACVHHRAIQERINAEIREWDARAATTSGEPAKKEEPTDA